MHTDLIPLYTNTSSVRGVSMSLWDVDPGWIMFAVVILFFISIVVWAIACVRNPAACSDKSS